MAVLAVGCSVLASVPDTSDVSADAIGVEFVISLTTYRVTASDEAMVVAHDPRTVFDSIPREVSHGGSSYTVTAIGDGAFQGDTIRELVLPYTVRSIGDRAFKGCVNLESIILTSGIPIIGTSAFEGCVKLKTVPLLYNAPTVGQNAFKGCVGIEAMDFSNVNASVDLSGAFPFEFDGSPGNLSGKMFKRNASGTFEEKTLYKLTINTFGTAELYGYYAAGEAIPSDATAEPSRSGSLFIRWLCEGVAPPTAMPAHDVEIDAIWGAIEYEFTFWTGGESQTYRYTKEQIMDGSITLPSDPTMASTPKYSYEFVDWLPPSEITVSDRDYVGQFNATLRSYDVTFKNGGQVLSTTIYEYGTPAGDIARPADPVKPSDEQCTYTFAGWEPALSTVTGAAVYSARFEAVPVEYTVTFVVEGASESKAYPYGTSADAIRPRPDPVKAPDEQYAYAFTGWSPQLSEVTGNQTYTAVFLPVTREYTVTFKAGPGGTWSEKHAYNDILTLPDADDPSISGPGRTLTGWEASSSSGGPDAYVPGSEYTVTSDAVLTAVWEYSGTGWWDDEDEDYYPRPKPEEEPDTIVFVVAGVATLMSLITAWTVFFYKRD